MADENTITEAVLVPRKFKIEQKVNEYYYYITWCAENGKWAIEISDHSFFLTTKNLFDYRGHDTIYRDTPEQALAEWKVYAKRYLESKDEKRFIIDYFEEILDNRDQLDI